jgi:hypothetical protein
MFVNNGSSALAAAAATIVGNVAHLVATNELILDATDGGGNTH